jgi:hypothetical protein
MATFGEAIFPAAPRLSSWPSSRIWLSWRNQEIFGGRKLGLIPQSVVRTIKKRPDTVGEPTSRVSEYFFSGKFPQLCCLQRRHVGHTNFSTFEFANSIRPLNETPRKCGRKRPKAPPDVSDCHLNKHRLINSLGAFVNETRLGHESPQVVLPPKISPKLPESPDA